MSIGTSDALQFPYAFPFQNLTNATLEFWIDPSSPTGGDVVWGTLTAGDTNRFEIGFGSSFGPAFMNYRDPSGVLHRLGRTKVSTPAGEWTFLAFVKEGNRYSIYVNNSQTQHITTLESRTIDGSPNLPTSTGWSVNGRGILAPPDCCQFGGLLDEVRISDVALKPSDFLISTKGTPDTIYVQTSNTRVIRQYRGVSLANGAVYPTETLPTNDRSNGDVVYDPFSDTLWYPEGNGNSSNAIEVWQNASKANGQSPTVVSFPFGEGTAAFDGIHHLLFAAVDTGPEISVFASAESMNASSTPASVITLKINGSTSDRIQELCYDPSVDILFAEDVNGTIAVFDGFGSAAESAVLEHTNPTIAANTYLQGLFSPTGLAYVPPPVDVLFVGERTQPGDVVAVHNASTYNGVVDHSQVITGFSAIGGLAFDNVAHSPTDLLFVYDTSPVYVVGNGLTSTGPISGLLQSGDARVIYDGGSPNLGFGIALDPTH